MHKRRRTVLFESVNALLGGADLTLTSLGRHLAGPAKERHQIRKMDRLLGNRHIQQEQGALYQALNRLLIKHMRPIISVDWSCLSYKNKRYLLRASLCIKGRSFACYQTVHPQAHENNTAVHHQFLEELKAVLPNEVRPILVTDAVFLTLWFKKVVSLGWDYVGRIRSNRGQYCTQGQWHDVKHAYQQAGTTPCALGEVLLTKTNRFRCQLVCYQKRRQGRVKKNRKGSIAKGSYLAVKAKANREPWLLATSLTKETGLACWVVKCYAKRMQIEEEFRDTKSPHNGFGLERSRSKGFARVQVLLMISQLASLCCWILARLTIAQGRHVDYHANSITTPTILSAITLGKRVFRRIEKIPIQQFKHALQLFIAFIYEAHSYEYN